MGNLKHWTSRSVDDFAYRIASDFVGQIETKLETEEMSRSKFAEAIGVTAGRVSQVLNSPTHFNLKSIVSYAMAAGLKAAIIAYDDDDPKNDRGPINAQVFTSSWERVGRPRDLFELAGSAPRGAVYKIVGQSFYRPNTVLFAMNKTEAEVSVDLLIATTQGAEQPLSRENKINGD